MNSTPKQETIGERWHKEAETESRLKAFLTFFLAMAAILAIVFALGTSEVHGYSSENSSNDKVAMS